MEVCLKTVTFVLDETKQYTLLFMTNNPHFQKTLKAMRNSLLRCNKLFLHLGFRLRMLCL